MRVLAVIEAESLTGPAKNLLEFALLARPRGIEVILAVFARSGATSPFIKAARDADVKIEAINERRAFDTAVIAALRDAVARSRPDILQTHAVKSHFLARSSGLHKLAAWVAFHHGYTRPAARVLLYNQLDRWSLRAARRVITVSTPFRDQLIARGVPKDGIDIVHNAIASDWGLSARQDAAAVRSSLDIPPDARIILSAGRLSKEKDHLTLLKAVRRLPAAHVLIVGDGPERPAIEKAIKQLGLKGRATLAGHQPSVAAYYAIADTVVLSSRTEGSPNVLLEAMVSGVPVVATRVGGVPEHVEDGETALLVDPGDDAAMGSAIARLLEPGNKLRTRLIERADALVRERHAPEARVQTLTKIYESLLRQRRFVLR
ncbi:MAG: glycosyltransferase [Bryobacterales bacterium]|nr:glycosyltransferase [Bryobacterales bacterium]MBV9397685.1 glycosyltransferase [Bryobacterales bacterium]